MQYLGGVLLESGMFGDEINTPASAVDLRRAVGQVVLEGTKGGALVGVLERVGVLVDVGGAVDTTGGGERPVRHAVQGDMHSKADENVERKPGEK